jgi:hypothetical protein
MVVLAFGVLAVALAVVAGILTAWQQLRDEQGRSKCLSKVASRRLEAGGFRGFPDVTVNRRWGGRWQVSTYSPSLKDDPRDPSDHGRKESAALAAASKGFPNYHWTNRRLVLLIVTCGCLAAVLGFLYTLF